MFQNLDKKKPQREGVQFPKPKPRGVFLPHSDPILCATKCHDNLLGKFPAIFTPPPGWAAVGQCIVKLGRKEARNYTCLLARGTAPGGNPSIWWGWTTLPGRRWFPVSDEIWAENSNCGRKARVMVMPGGDLLFGNLSLHLNEHFMSWIENLRHHQT